MSRRSPPSLKDLPKIELHVHLDTSLRFDTVAALRPGLKEEDYRRIYVAPEHCDDLHHFLQCVQPSIALLQSKVALERAMLDLMEASAREKVLYTEIRLAPLLHTSGGLHAEEVVDIVCEALATGQKRYLIHGRLLFCTLRSFTEEASMETARLALAHRHRGVVGLDLAGEEGGNYSLEPHLPAFKYAREHGLSTTVHAGEAEGPQSVTAALEALQPQRIGHGVRSLEDQEVVRTLLNKRTHLEICPRSNIQTGVFPTMAVHTVDRLYKEGVSLNINTDGRGLTNTTLLLEYEAIQTAFAWTWQDFVRCNLMALEAAFCEPTLKEQLLPQINLIDR